MTAARFGILFVCTGNICRSAFAELLARRMLDEALPPADAARVAVASAGCEASRGSGIHPLTRAELAAWRVTGPVVDAHVARQVDAGLLAGADLVLTAERHHRAHVVRTYPGALHGAFCLREFHRLLSTVDRLDPVEPVARLRAAVDAAATRRGTIPPVAAGDDAVPDPFGGPAEAHHHSTMLIGALLRDLVAVLAPPRHAGAGLGYPIRG